MKDKVYEHIATAHTILNSMRYESRNFDKHDIETLEWLIDQAIKYNMLSGKED